MEGSKNFKIYPVDRSETGQLTVRESTLEDKEKPNKGAGKGLVGGLSRIFGFG